MSKHWNPDIRWLSEGEFKALNPAQRRALFAARGQARRERAALQSWRRVVDASDGRPAIRRPSATMAVLLGAVFAGVVAGAVLSWRDAPSPARAVAPAPAPEPAQAQEQTGAAPKASEPALTLPPDPSEIAWERRSREGAAATDESGLPRASSARNDGGVRLSFGYCKWGGGTNCVVDGDTFWIEGQDVRIADIDAPETHDYDCQSELALGNRATERLHALLNSGAVTLTAIDRDRDVYGRLLRNVAVNGQDVGAALVAAGLARPWEGHRRPWC